MPPKRGRKKNENSAVTSELTSARSAFNKKEPRGASKRKLKNEEAEVENSGESVAKSKAKREKTLKIVLEDDITGNNSNRDKEGIDEPSKKSKSPRKNKNDDIDQPPDKKAKTTEKLDTTKVEDTETIYQFKATDINGKEISLDTYKGHVCIIVNVASKCGHTKSNYEQFVELFDKYSEENGLRILAFPCNQFGKQEPGDAKKICEFAQKRNVKFDMFEKVEVNGKNAHPLWKFLTSKIKGPKGANIEWNFTKFIIDKAGKVVERHKSSVKPNQLVVSLENYW